MPHLLPKPLLWIVALSLMALAALLYGTTQGLAPAYYGTMCLLGWIAFHGDRGPRLQSWLQSLPGPPLLRAVLLGYAAVVAEETLVGTTYTLNEGFTATIWVERVSQFIAFNLLAFTGAILGLTLATRFMPGLSHWHLIIAGGWGIFAERSYLLFFGNPIAGALIAGPNIAVYSIILAPMVLSMPGHSADGHGRKLWAPLVAWALMLALSLPAVALLMYLRSTYPAAFPNCEYISCT
jgi:hypothetical protein